MQIDVLSKRQRLTADQHSADLMEITHVTDSMPGTAVSPKNRRPQRQPVTTRNDKMVTISRAELDRLREERKDWEPRQHKYEIVSSENRTLQQKLAKMETDKENAAKNRECLDRRIDKLRDENANLRRRLKELEDVYIMSKDEQLAEITRLRQQLHEEKTKCEAAIRFKESMERDFNFLRDQLHNAQDRVRDWKQECEDLKAKQPSLEALAHGQTKELKRIHYSACEEALREENKRLKQENSMQKKMIEQKEQEIAKYKTNGRGGYSTRQSSVPRSPRVGSRGGSRPGSPAPTGRDRVMHLRNG